MNKILTLLTLTCATVSLQAMQSMQVEKKTVQAESQAMTPSLRLQEATPGTASLRSQGATPGTTSATVNALASDTSQVESKANHAAQESIADAIKPIDKEKLALIESNKQKARLIEIVGKIIDLAGDAQEIYLLEFHLRQFLCVIDRDRQDSYEKNRKLFHALGVELMSSMRMLLASTEKLTSISSNTAKKEKFEATKKDIIDTLEAIIYLSKREHKDALREAEKLMLATTIDLFNEHSPKYTSKDALYLLERLNSIIYVISSSMDSQVLKNDEAFPRYRRNYKNLHGRPFTMINRMENIKYINSPCYLPGVGDDRDTRILKVKF